MIQTAPSSRAGITSVECLVIGVAMFLGCIGARYGLAFGWLGAGLGFAVGVSAALGVVFIQAILYDLIWGGMPPTPHCRCGARDYDHLAKLESGQWVSRCCQCGRRYQRRGRQFVEIDQSRIPRCYLKWVPFAGWREETE